MKGKTLLVLLGPHAVGKMTVGQELSRLTGLTLFHNHMSIEFVRKLFPFKSKEGQYLNSLIRREVFETMANSDLSGMIFTYMFDFDEPTEYEYIGKLIGLFTSHGAKCCVAELCADFDVRLMRNKTENRLANKESKRDLAASEAEMLESSKKYRLNSRDDEKLPFENYFKLDNTHLSPSQAAQKIIEAFSLR